MIQKRHSWKNKGYNIKFDMDHRIDVQNQLVKYTIVCWNILQCYGIEMPIFLMLYTANIDSH